MRRVFEGSVMPHGRPQMLLLVCRSEHACCGCQEGCEEQQASSGALPASLGLPLPVPTCAPCRHVIAQPVRA